MEERKIVLKKDLLEGFEKIGLKAGDNVMVHTSLKSFGFVCGGAQVVIEALLETVGKDGTVIMPTQSWKNLDPLAGVHWEEPEEWWPLIRENWPAYDKNITPTNTMGAVAEMFRKWPGAVRSDHPARSFAAWGKNAEYLTSGHDLRDIFGESSPLAKLYALDGKVLLLGTGYDKNTSIHLADVRAEYPGKRYADESSAMMVNGKREWVTYNTLVVDGEDFEQIGETFEKEVGINSCKIGNATVKCMSQKKLVDFSVEWIEKNRK
ncbi:MAG: AAC(3) family N-acetyltransferase [Treponema sp.]|nr:AAC(3) family N-acetyltransferase [Treponema sp.]